MRYYLDTNILAFLITERHNELTNTVKDEIFDFANSTMTSSVCIQELIHLCQIGKLSMGRKKVTPSPTEVLNWMHEMGIKIISVSENHLSKFAGLPFHGEHRDPNDRLIIAQAISDRIPLISSDGNFSDYIDDGLEFIYNER